MFSTTRNGATLSLKQIIKSLGWRSEQKVFGIGLSRTGTTSLHQTMQGLGLRSKHFVLNQLSLNPAKNFPRLMAQNDFVNDTPIPAIFPTCDRQFPGSKFILTTRNKNDWLRSMNWMFNHGKYIWRWDLLSETYHLNFLGINEYNEKILSKKYDLYHQAVFDYFKGRESSLLVVPIDQGINAQEISKFIGVAYNGYVQGISNARDRNREKTAACVSAYIAKRRKQISSLHPEIYSRLCNPSLYSYPPK